MSLQAQVTTDVQRPFDQGQAIELPGATEYLGNLPEEIEWLAGQAPFHTTAGLLAQKVGWVGPGTPSSLGINGGSPGILFEGIPYPFESAAILDWLPVTQDLELLDFPASAWWGPSTTRGAVQIRLPDWGQGTGGSLALQGGAGGLGSGEGGYRDTHFSFDGNAQHGFLNGSPSDTFNIRSGMQWTAGSPFTVESGFLGSQWFGVDNWYAFFSSFKWSSPNFQSLELKPFVQTARLNGLQVQEYGSNLNYHFNMAGLVESQLGLGFSRDDFPLGEGLPALEREYVQNTENFDALGNLILNMAFRWDFSSAANTSFSTVLGAQYLLGDFQLLGNYAKGVDPVSILDLSQGELGFRYQPGDDLSFTCKYAAEQAGSSSWQGGKINLEWAPEEPIIGFFRDVRLEFEGQFLEGTGGNVLDTGGRIDWSFFHPVAFWIGGRGISGVDAYGNGGIDILIKNQAKIYLSVENFTNRPVSWPDLTAPTGRIVWLGVKTHF